MHYVCAFLCTWKVWRTKVRKYGDIYTRQLFMSQLIIEFFEHKWKICVQKKAIPEYKLKIIFEDMTRNSFNNGVFHSTFCLKKYF